MVSVAAQLVDTDQFIECLLELCKVWSLYCWAGGCVLAGPPYRHYGGSCTTIIRSGDGTTLSHGYQPPLHSPSSTAGLGEEERTTAELAFDRNYVRQKLDNGLVRIWRVSCCNPVSIMLPSLLLYRMFSRRCDHIYWQWTCLAFSMIL